jgi:hypothetical protein
VASTQVVVEDLEQIYHLHLVVLQEQVVDLQVVHIVMGHQMQQPIQVADLVDQGLLQVVQVQLHQVMVVLES